MRFLPVLLTILACSSAASAQDRVRASDAAPASVPAATQDAAPSPVTAAPAATAGSSVSRAATPARKARVTWEQRFAQANTTHDGHLTLEQAKAGYASVARHFADIDVAKKGFVTEDDVRTWHKAHHAKRRGHSAS